jgi:hypothetical protein
VLLCQAERLGDEFTSPSLCDGLLKVTEGAWDALMRRIETQNPKPSTIYK